MAENDREGINFDETEWEFLAAIDALEYLNFDTSMASVRDDAAEIATIIVRCARRADLAAPDAAQWSKELPKKSGWYFMRNEGEEPIADGLVVWVGHNASGIRHEGKFFYADDGFLKRREFLGPITMSIFNNSDAVRQARLEEEWCSIIDQAIVERDWNITFTLSRRAVVLQISHTDDHDAEWDVDKSFPSLPRALEAAANECETAALRAEGEGGEGNG